VTDETCRSLPSWVAPALLALVGGVVPIAIAWHFGALGIPRNDDWVYALAAFRFADTAKLNGYGSRANLVGQLVLSLPVVWLFGHRIAALHVEVAAFGVVGLLALFDLTKQVLSPRRALFVAVMIAVGPMWASLSAAYMTDVPAFALGMICLTLGARAVRPDDINARLFCAALLVGFLAFAVRDYAIVSPLSVCLTGLWAAGRWPRRRLFMVIAAVVSLVALAAVFWAWRRGLPGFYPTVLTVPSLSSTASALHTGAQAAVLVGLLASPAVLLAGPGRLVKVAWTRAPRTSIAITFVTVLVLGNELVSPRPFGVALLPRPYLGNFLGPGNYVLPNGVLGSDTLAGTRADLFPTALFASLALIGFLATVLLVLTALPPLINALGRARHGQLGTPTSPALSVVTLGAVGYGFPCALPALFGPGLVFDRFLLPLVALVGVLALDAGGARAVATRGIPIVGGAALLALAAFGAVYAANSASFDGTKWSVAEQVARLARSPERVDGGYEWDGYHAGKDLWHSEPIRLAASSCIVLQAEPRPGGGGRDLRAARVWGPTGKSVWIVARQRHSC
jgi:Dolichyl-phosphate-mannose-protein mannosyltransferase